MNAIKRVLAVVVTLTFTLVALAGQAGSRNDGTRRIELRESAVMLGSTVQPGWYTLAWTREPGSEEVRVALTSGRKVVASGKGLWVQSERSWPFEALVYHTERGVDELAEIRFSKSTDSILIEAPMTRADAGRGSDTEKQ
jgi:hypothetical protein